MMRLADGIPVARAALLVCIPALLTIAGVGLAHGQDTTTARREGWIVGPLLGVPGVGSDYDASFFTLGLGVTRLVPNRPGLDFAIGTVPRVISDGYLPVGVRLGPSIPLALSSDAFIIPSAGVSVIGAVGSGGAAGTGAFYWGASLVAAHGPVGFRAGATWHRPYATDQSLWLVEVGVMHVPLAHSSN